MKIKINPKYYQYPCSSIKWTNTIKNDNDNTIKNDNIKNGIKFITKY